MFVCLLTVQEVLQRLLKGRCCLMVHLEAGDSECVNVACMCRCKYVLHCDGVPLQPDSYGLSHSYCHSCSVHCFSVLLILPNSRV